MQIPELKSRLNLLDVAAHLGIEIDPRTNRAHCPFHADKSPSLQFSEAKQICTCFSGNCDAGTMDVIGLTEKKLGVSTHEAIMYLKELTGQVPAAPKSTPETETPDYAAAFKVMQSSLISSSTARKYAESRALDWKKLGLGYNSLRESKYPYLRGCITFALKDEQGQVVSLYGRSTRRTSTSSATAAKGKHYYTANRRGLYPQYPAKPTQTLILTESVIDAASLMLALEVDKAENWSVNLETCSLLALYGTNGLNAEHLAAMKNLPDLQEVILFFDGDKAGEIAANQHAHTLHTQLPNVQISRVCTPQDEDINGLWSSHLDDIFPQLVRERKPFFLSPEKEKAPNPPDSVHSANFDHSVPHNLRYQTETAHYAIKGGLRPSLESLKITLEITHPETRKKLRDRVELYQYRQVEALAQAAADKLGLRADQLESDLSELTDLLDQYRESQREPSPENMPKLVSSSEKDACLAFLQQPNLLPRINELIGESGVVGEEMNRLCLFVIASSYAMPQTLHGLIQGSSGSGKTHLLASILSLMPEEEVIQLTRITESSLYNYPEHALSHKLIGIEDYDGLEEKAELAWRELLSKGMISSSTSGKDERTGQISAYVRYVYGPIASLAATTRGEVYEDNLSRCFLIAVDESTEQTQRIIAYQNAVSAGKIDKQARLGTRDLLQNCLRMLEPYEVVNPFAEKLHLPQSAHKIRRLHELFQSFIQQITLLNQYQRERDGQGRLVTTKEDVATAIELMFESIVLKVDELDGGLRQFYEGLKGYVKAKGSGYRFGRRELREVLGVRNTTLHRHIERLLALEYLEIAGGYPNRGLQYRVRHWDDNAKMRHQIRENLERQLSEL